MARQLRTLIVDDSENDALLIEWALKKGGFEVEARRVQTAEEMVEALDSATWDVVISDFRMPRFDTYSALDLLHERGLDTPCIVVSGVIPVENALAFVRAGARDFVEKGDLERLVPVIEREIANRVNADERVPVGALFAVLECCSDALLLLDPRSGELPIVFANTAAGSLAGQHPEVLAGQPLAALFVDPSLAARVFEQVQSAGETAVQAQGRHPHYGTYDAHWHVRQVAGLGYWLMSNRMVHG